MNVVMMTNTYAPIMGGLEKSVETFSHYLREASHQVTVVAPEFEGQPKNEKNVVRLPALQKFNGTDFSIHIPIPGELEDLMETLKPDIVHAHHPFLLGDLALRLCGQYDVPLIFTYHTMFDQYTHYLPVEQEAARKFMISLSLGFANLTDHVVVPSESVLEILKNRGLTTPATVIPTGVDIEKFKEGNGDSARKKFKIPAESLLMGHTGRLAKEKNLPFLIRAVSAYMIKDENAHFLIAGTGPDEKEMKEMFREAGVDDRVHFAGRLEGEDLVNAYHAMDVFVFSSKSETQGMVLTEAMAAGMPVIGLDAPGVREVILDGKNGRLIKDQNMKAFTDGISWYAALSAEDRNNVQEQARNRAEEFSIARSVEKLQTLYTEVKRREGLDREGKDNDWSRVMNRVKTEWEMLSNLRHAATAAVTDSEEEEKD